uniref:Putative tenascin-x n=2 Tax=Ixodes ricinus TaxID=34613 RepID=V5ID59_IXORI
MSRFYFFVVNSVVILYVLNAAAKGGTGGPCDTDDNCRRDGHFVCRNRTCTCLPGYYEELVNSSLTCSYVGVPVGERCLSDESCINGNRTRCGSRRVCVCRKNFYEHGGICKTGRKLGEACRSDSQCEAGSNASYCRGSTCRCRDGYYQESIGGNTTCVPGNPPLLLCYTNYDCFIRDRHLVCDGRFCRCRQGYHTELTAWGWRCADSSGLQRPVHGGVVSVFRISPAAILIACIILGYMKRRQKPEAGPGVHDGRTFGGRPHRYILPFRRGVSLREVAQRGQGERTGDSFDHLLPPAAAVANLPPEPPPYQTDEQEPPPSYEEAVRSIPPSASAASTTATQQTTTNLTTRRA